MTVQPKEAELDLVRAIIAAYHTTRLAEVSAEAHILSKGSVRKSLDRYREEDRRAPAVAGEVDIRAVVWSAMERARTVGESREMAARWIAEDVRAALRRPAVEGEAEPVAWGYQDSLGLWEVFSHKERAESLREDGIAITALVPARSSAPPAVEAKDATDKEAAR